MYHLRCENHCKDRLNFHRCLGEQALVLVLVLVLVLAGVQGGMRVLAQEPLMN